MIFSSTRRAFAHPLAVFAMLLALATVGLVPPAAAQSASPDPERETAVVAQLQEGLVSILTADGRHDAGARSAALGKLVADTFDINAMGAVAVGQATYRSWSDAQRDAFLTAFARFMVATHASRFENVVDPQFEIESSEDAQAGRKIVHSRYLRADAEPVSVDYLVQATETGWRVLDVYLDGTISLLALHRSEFASVLRDRGFDGFITAMNDKADELTPDRVTN